MSVYVYACVCACVCTCVCVYMYVLAGELNLINDSTGKVIQLVE